MKFIRRTNIKKKKLSGFTLSELLMVLSIMGILILLALPSFMPLIAKTKQIEAKLQLKHVLQLEKSYYFMNSKYSGSFNEIGYEPSKMVSEGGNANYKIEVSDASNKGFVATATSITDFDNDGVFNVWQMDQNEQLKETTPD
ncbi:MAG: type IV pilin protein [Bacteroidota bacterium]|nr:type IV pilin protein [Bacteroidota bacterium]